MLKSSWNRYKNKIVWIRIDLLFSFLTNFPEPSSLMTMKVCKEWINFYFCWIHQFELSHRIQIAELDQAKNPLVVSDTAFKNRNTRLCLQGFLKSDSRRSRISPLIVDVFWRGLIMFLLTLYKCINMMVIFRNRAQVLPQNMRGKIFDSFHDEKFWN